MKKLDKATIARRDSIIDVLETRFMDLEAAIDGYNNNMTKAWTALEAAVDAFNAKLDEEWGGLEPMIEDLNSAIADANGWRQDVVSEINEYIENRSEKWQQSDAAQRYFVWRDEFDHEYGELSIERPDDISIDAPDEASMDDLDNVVELLSQLPEELDSEG